MLEFLSMSHCLHMAQQTLVYLTTAFPTSCEQPSPTSEVPSPTPNILFCFQLKMVLKARVSAILASDSISLGLSHIHMLLNFCLTFCVNLSHVRQLEEPRKVEEISLPNSGHGPTAKFSKGWRFGSFPSWSRVPSWDKKST